MAAGQLGLRGSSSNGGSNSSRPALTKLWLDEQQLSTDVLGSGATGQVVLGTYAGRPVAAKVVELADAFAATKRSLLREAEVVLQVSGECRHTCQYKGAVIKANKYASSLARVIADDGEAPSSLPLPCMLRYGAQALAALHELHEQGIVMLDLKPQNLLLDEGLDELVAADFGLSRVLSQTQHQVDESGNPQPLTPAVDLWAWACTVLHMATGSAPFANLRESQIVMHVGVSKRPPAIPGSLPEPLRQLLAKCLTVEASQRPSAKEALQAVSSRLVELLESDDTAVQQAAAYALGALAAASMGNSASIMAVPNVFKRLVALLSSSSAAVQQAAAGAIGALAAGSTHSNERLKAVPGVISKLVHF
ncbi:kinase-like domain-containing protein [Scenedesmus sp. NREL 46B-D3]|nr:kinase-like domain-containing protein [Scenedesmus sp. NREL 46B-D3]